MSGDYRAFLASKLAAVPAVGFDAPASDLPAGMKPFQTTVARWACRLGRAAVFAGTGLGKTLVQLAWADRVRHHAGGPVLVLAPLAVGPQTVREAGKFGIAGVRPAESQADVAGAGVYVTNYQKLHKFDPAAFAGAVLDESSILKDFTGKTRRGLQAAFERTPYKLCCTATPAPNDHLELGNHAEFLGVMPANEMLSRWFINNPEKAGDYRLKGHAAADYWRWVTSWACCLTRPSDLGFRDEGYDLPPLAVLPVIVKVDVTADAGGRLFRSDCLSAAALHREMRRTAPERCRAAADLVAAEPGRPWLVWCNTDYEQDELERLMPAAASVRGSTPERGKESALLGFADGTHRVLVTKPSVAGWGMNWQHCDRMAFVGLSYSFEAYYQAVRRCWRFGQPNPVTAYVVQAETEGEVAAAVRSKEAQYAEMTAAMSAAAREHWHSEEGRRSLRLDYEPLSAAGDGWEMLKGDCVEETRKLPDASIDFAVFSPPFSNLYIYSDSARDMGNAADDREFFRHFGYLVPELLRVTVPGRLCAVHCKDLPLYANRDGYSGLQDFPGEISRAFTSAGWVFHSRVTIWKCPVTERERTNAHGLLHATILEDSTRVRQGMADYLLVFRRPPVGGTKSDKPVARPAGFEHWPGDPDLDPRQTDRHPSKYARRPGRLPRVRTLPDGRAVDLTPSVTVWQRLAEPVWWHIDQRDVLNYEIGKADKDEKHICPLQLGVVKEAVYLWTNPGDRVFSPFAGIGSEGYQSVLMGRRFVGVELKDSYFRVACRNLERAAKAAKQTDLFAGVE